MARSWVILLACYILLSPWTTLDTEAADHKGLDYDYGQNSPIGPPHWGSLSPNWAQCGEGKEQSPINISTSSSILDPSLGVLNFTYVPSEGFLVNSGHDIEIDFGPGAGSFTLGQDEYHLTTYHFHAPSEHVIQGIRFPLELHLVHTTDDFKKIAVVGVVFKKGKSNRFLRQIWDHLPAVSKVGANVSVGIVSMKYLHLGVSYARYRGSLTVPPCTEGLSWNLHLSERNTVSQSQLGALEKVIKHSNARPLQPLNGRSVERFPSSAGHEPSGY